jgi:hypothetical protein
MGAPVHCSHDPAPPPRPSGPREKGLKGFVQAVDEYTSPRATTAGNFHKHDYGQGLLHAVGTGYAFSGWSGMGITAACALACTFVGRKTDSRIATLVAGAATGVLASTALAAATGAPLIAAAGAGAMLGGFQAMCSDKLARVRDAAEGGTLLTSLLLPGTAKIAGAIGAGLGVTHERPVLKAATGALIGAGLGAACAVAGMTGGSVLGSALISGLGGAVGPLIGPRIAQFFRNFANDTGKLVMKGLEKTPLHGRLDERKANCLGAYPATVIREGIMGMAEADFSLVGLATASITESAEMIWTFLRSENGKGEEHHGHVH